VSGNGAYPGEMEEVALFTDALRAAVPAQPSRELTAAMVPRLAAVARTATIEAETKASRRPAATPVRRSRRALVAKVGIAVASIPLLLAGLAFAGVTVPGPARDAFDSVGITLPNQPADHHQAPTNKKEPQTTTGEGGGNDVSNAAKTKPKGKGGNSTAAHEHARKQHEKAQGKAKGHDQGKAVGLNGSPPPGQAKTPPGQAKTPPGQAKTPPGQATKTTPGRTKTSSGQATIPPGQSKTPPGQSEK
jgi:hypothetical protein